MPFNLIWGTGFELGNYPVRTGYMTWAGLGFSTPGKTGNYYATLAGGGNNLTKIIPGSLSEVYVSFFFIGSGAANSFYIMLEDGSSLECRWSQLTQTVDAYVNSAKVASGVKAAEGGAWIHFQMHVIISDTVGVLETKIDGNTDIAYSGDTKPGSSSVIASFRWSTASTGTAGAMDDISIGSGGWPGDIRYSLLVPVADTATHDWKPNGVSLQENAVAPTVGVSAGPGITGAYSYKVTVTDSFGETLGGVASATVNPSNQVVSLSNIPLGLPGTTNRKLYRTANGGSTYKLCATISDNVTTTYNDSMIDSSLGANETTNIHWDKIDEKPASDADFIYIATNGAQDLHSLSQWDPTYKKPLYVVQWIRSLKGTADSQQIKMLMKSGSTLNSGSALEQQTSIALYDRILATNPDGNVPWTAAAINALQIGEEAVVP